MKKNNEDFKHNIWHGQFQKNKEGKLVCIDKDKTKYKLFVNSLEVDQVTDVFMESITGSGTLAQLAKIHACIRELAKENGDSFEDMKFNIKRMSGLCIKKKIDDEYYMVCKSFADASKEELALVIQAITEVGITLNINFQ